MPEWMIDFLAYELRVWEDEAVKKEDTFVSTVDAGGSGRAGTETAD